MLLLNADSDSADLRIGLRVCSTKKFPGETDAAGPGPTRPERRSIGTRFLWAHIGLSGPHPPHGFKGALQPWVGCSALALVNRQMQSQI